MKRVLSFCLVILLLGGLIYFFREDINSFLYQKYILDEIKISDFNPNEYYRKKDYEFVQITNDFEAKDKKHLLNIYYTIINSGAENFTFRCDIEYKECLDDVAEISKDQSVLSYINSFIHPFNGFSSVETLYDNLGKVELIVNKAYTDEEISIIKNKMQTIINTINNTSNNEKIIIKNVHDYIINNTKYDKERSDNNIIKYKSDLAYGALIEGYALCGGYTDSMALFLDYYNIPNFKISSDNHIWNAVYLNGEWRHLDLTWDDPVTTSGRDLLEYNFFLIDDNELKTQDLTEHTYDIDIYKEFAK